MAGEEGRALSMETEQESAGGIRCVFRCAHGGTNPNCGVSGGRTVLFSVRGEGGLPSWVTGPRSRTPRVASGTLIGLHVCVLLCPEGFEMVSHLTEYVVYTFPHK